MIPPTAKTAWFLRRICAMRSVKTVLVASEAIADRTSIPQAKVRIVPNGIDRATYQSQPASRDDIRAELGVSGAAHLAAVVGELSPGKGQLEAIQSLATLVENGHEASLAIIGSARPGNEQYATQLRDAVAEMALEERVKFTAHRNDVQRLLNGVDLLLVPSRGPSGEACPMVVLEAWVTGVPVLASDIGGLPGMIGHERGVLFDPNEQNAFAHEWQELIAHPERGRQLSDAGLAAVSDQYSANKAMARIQSALTDAISA
jgi:glycosyltransferase involved in cell wall biosynthesis